MRRSKAFDTNALLILFIIMEHLFLYYFFRNGILTQGKNAIGLFLSSIFFGIVLLYRFYNAELSAIEKPAKNEVTFYAVIASMLAGFVILGFAYNDLFKLIPVSLSISDIIPGIQIVCKRLLAGQYAYDLLWDFGGPQVFPYLPFHWMPFTIAEYLHFDYRWVAYVAWCIAALWLCARNIRIQTTAMQLIIPVLIFASNYVLFSRNSGIIYATVELLITAYYIMLIIGLNQQNGIVQGLLISFCLLSRYSVVLWLPLYAFVLYISKNRKQLYQSMATVAVMVLLFYVWPFMSKHWSIFYDGYKSYDNAAHFEWAKNLRADGKPAQLFSGTGFAYFFYTRFTQFDVMQRVKMIQRAHLICSVGITVVLGIWYWFNKEKINFKVFLLASFKIYLAVFLFFIQVPYEYLMCLGNFVSIAIFCEQARYRIMAKAEGLQTTVLK